MLYVFLKHLLGAFQILPLRTNSFQHITANVQWTYFPGKMSKCEVWKFKSKINGPISHPDNWKPIFYWGYEKMHDHVSE